MAIFVASSFWCPCFSLPPSSIPHSLGGNGLAQYKLSCLLRICRTGCNPPDFLRFPCNTVEELPGGSVSDGFLVVLTVESCMRVPPQFPSHLNISGSTLLRPCPLSHRQLAMKCRRKGERQGDGNNKQQNHREEQQTRPWTETTNRIIDRNIKQNHRQEQQAEPSTGTTNRIIESRVPWSRMPRPAFGWTRWTSSAEKKCVASCGFRAIWDAMPGCLDSLLNFALLLIVEDRLQSLFAALLILSRLNEGFGALLGHRVNA